MKAARTALLAAFALAACRPAGDEAPVAPEPPALAAAELAGEYRVAGVDATDIDLPHAITASISADRIHIVSDSVNLAGADTQQGAALTTQRVPVEGCARGYEPAEMALLAALDVADSVRRTPANAIEFSGDGHSVTLFSQ
jgi:hypothetical protein